MREVVVVVGVGGMGLACARRLGPGRKLVIADHDATRLADCTAELQSNGLDVVGHAVDVSVRAVGRRSGRCRRSTRTTPDLGPYRRSLAHHGICHSGPRGGHARNRSRPCRFPASGRRRDRRRLHCQHGRLYGRHVRRARTCTRHRGDRRSAFDARTSGRPGLRCHLLHGEARQPAARRTGSGSLGGTGRGGC